MTAVIEEPAGENGVVNSHGDQPLARLARCETAEDYFRFLDVPFDPKVVNVNRLHILRHFATQLAEMGLGGTDQDNATDAPSADATATLAAYRQALVRSYQAFTTGTALDHRVFKVLADHAPEAFVPTDEVTIQRFPGKPDAA